MNELLSHYLGDRGASVYIAALQLGNTTIDKISQKTELPRSSCYLIITELEEKGLVSRNTRGKKELIQAESPERLVDYLQREKDQAQNGVQQILTELPQYMALYNTGKEKKPSCRYYEGFNGVKLILEDSLRAKEILVLCSGYSGVIEPRLSKYLDTYFDEVERKGIRTYELLGGSPDTKDYIGT
ncbi:MAG: helix-turn-helix domain-containing protein, partial [Patescibacteria group bacterium]